MRSDFDSDYEWLEHCSNCGVTEHQLNLASLILTSRTDGKRTVEAYKWLFAADALGNPAASELLGFLRRSMTVEQVQEADSMFESWLDARNIEYTASKTNDWGQELHAAFKNWQSLNSQTIK